LLILKHTSERIHIQSITDSGWVNLYRMTESTQNLKGLLEHHAGKGVRMWVSLFKVAVEITMFIVILVAVAKYRKEYPGLFDVEDRMYYTTRVDIEPKWKLTEKARVAIDNDQATFNTTRAEFATVFQCDTIRTHEMCGCLLGDALGPAARNTTELQGCLLESNIPLLMKPALSFNLLSNVLFWFGFSVASSIVAFGYQSRAKNAVALITDALNRTPGSDMDPASKQGDGQKDKSWTDGYNVGNIVVILGVLCWFTVLIMGSIYNQSVLAYNWRILVITISTVVVLAVAYYDHIKEIAMSFMGQTPIEKRVSDLKLNGRVTDVNAFAILLYEFHNTGVKQFLFYGNILICIPAMVAVFHSMHHWLDQAQLVNTIFLFTILVVIDGFSVYVSSQWESNTIMILTHAQNVQVGTIKMFAWMINILIIYLLLTINYPIVIDDPTLAYGLFALGVLYFSVTFLVPDLIREYTHVYTVHSLEIRTWGEFLLRVLAVIYICFHIQGHIDYGIKKALAV
jgi:hypothetical protein